MPQTYLNSSIRIGGDLSASRAPMGITEQESRYVLAAHYSPHGTAGASQDCVVKQLHAPLTRAQVHERLERVTPIVMRYRWEPQALHVLSAAPLAALPIDYCESATPGQYDAAVLARVGDCSLEEVRRNPLSAPAMVHALGDIRNRMHVVRAIATALTAAQTEARLPHLDVADRNVRVSLPENGRPIRAYLIDWDEGLEGTESRPADEEGYPWSHEIQKVYERFPWRLDWFALMRYLVWCLDSDWPIFEAITEPVGDSRALSLSLIKRANEAAKKVTSDVLRDLLRKVALLARIRGVAPPPELLPHPVEYVIALRSECEATRASG